MLLSKRLYDSLVIGVVVYMKNCPNCGKEITGEFCSNCGYKKSDKPTREELLKLYVGKNWDKLYNSQWNWCAFFFCYAYYLYRKLWGPGFAIFAITILINLAIEYLNIPSAISFFILLAFFALSASLFPSIYTYYANKKVDEMLANNLSYEECQKICKKSGGASTFIAVTLGTFEVITLIIDLLLALFVAFIVYLLTGGAM